MQIAVTAARAPGEPRARGGTRRHHPLRRAGVWLCLAGLDLGCSREPRVRLALDAPLPEQLSQSTTLELGDPTVQRQLELTGSLAAVPFSVNWQNISGGPQTIRTLVSADALRSPR